jgi:CubicO group peptidase (beta-lactamase class C family)
MNIRVLLFLLIVAFQIAAQTLPGDFDNFIARVQKTFEVPGISIAIVQDGEVILASGYGVKRLGEQKPVDELTLFGIASNTKAFTATALALLVEEDKLDWEGRVVDYLPWFQMSDPYVTREMTIRDLLVHRSGLGLGAGDLLWWPASTYTRKEIVQRLRYVPLKTSFRSAYAYDNVLYTVAGEVINEVSGLSWEDFVRTRILQPVGMTGTDVRHSAGGAAANIATPHAHVEGKLSMVEPFTSDNVNPAGGIHSNAVDMAKWMIVQLDSGRLANGSHLFSPQSTKELWNPITPLPVPDYPKELEPLQMNFNGYALGFGVRDYQGYKLVTHTGGLPGYLSRVAMIPQKKLGVTVLTNQESSAAFNTIYLHILDHLLGNESYDWLSTFQNLAEQRKKRIAQAEQNTEQIRDETSKPSLPLERYGGSYMDDWYGAIEIINRKGKLIIQFSRTPVLHGELEHWQHDTFVVRWYDRSLRGDAFITFWLNPEGTIEQVKMKPFSPAVDFSFDYQDLVLKSVR